MNIIIIRLISINSKPPSSHLHNTTNVGFYWMAYSFCQILLFIAVGIYAAGEGNERIRLG